MPREKQMFDEEAVEQLNHECKQSNSMQEVERLVETKYPDLLPYIFDPRRSAHLLLLSQIINKTGITMLDIGAGFGTIARQIAPRTKKYYAVEPVKSRFGILKQLARLSKSQNIVPVNQSMFKLDLDQKFDVVLFNGVLEWAGQVKEDCRDPRTAQIEALNECKKHLKPDGLVIIAIENRYSPLYLKTLDHNRLRFTSYMPRWMANYYTKKRKKHPYLTYTYDAKGYEELIQDAGFKKTRIMGCYPVYRYPKLVFDLDPQTIEEMQRHFSASKRQKWYFKALKWSMVARKFAPSFIIFASNATIKPKLAGQLLYNGAGQLVKIFNIEKNTVISVPRDPAYTGLEDLAKKTEMLNHLKIGLNKQNNYLTEPYQTGKYPLTQFNEKEQIKAIRHAYSRLRRLYASTIRAENAQAYLKKINYTGKAKDDIQTVLAHGDWHPNNILWNGQETYLTDLEHMQRASIYFDIYTYLFLETKHTGTPDIIIEFLQHKKNTVGGELRNCLNDLQDNFNITFPFTQIPRLVYHELVNNPSRKDTQAYKSTHQIFQEQLNQFAEQPQQ
ncbi:MAG: methyltransferase domain-containing protein [Candidatus Ranarchaeia archaeon]